MSNGAKKPTGALRARQFLRIFATVRARTVSTAVVVLSVALCLASLLLVGELSRTQLSGIDHALSSELAAASTLIEHGVPRAPLPISSQETSFIQVVDRHGHVVAGSSGIEGESRITSATPKVRAIYFTGDNLPIGSGDRFRIAAINVLSPSGPMTVYVGESLAVVDRSTQDVIWALSLADPLLIVVVALTLWFLVGRALRPVELLRAEVEEISGKQLDRRVAEPLSHDEVGRLAITMNVMLERLEKFALRQKSFVADASHELRSPLAAAQAELEVSLTLGAAADWPDSVHVALGELERVRRIVDDLSLLASYDEDEVVVKLQSVDLDEIVMEQCSRLQRLSQVQVDVSQVSGARVAGDVELLRRVVWNLLDNAQRHARSKVRVSLAESSGQAVMRVSDDGPGVAPQDRLRIFERFVRADDARNRVHGGSGLGLAIVSDILELHHGSIEITETEIGAEFEVRLPIIF